jgi:uncharacterized protein (DUF983 family)
MWHGNLFLNLKLKVSVVSTSNKEVTNSKSKDPSASLAVSIVMAAAIGFGVVSFWRGVWYLWDVLTFTRPEDKLLSALASLLTGLVILGVMRTFYSVLAPPMNRVNIRPHEKNR